MGDMFFSFLPDDWLLEREVFPFSPNFLVTPLVSTVLNPRSTGSSLSHTSCLHSLSLWPHPAFQVAFVYWKLHIFTPNPAISTEFFFSSWTQGFSVSSWLFSISEICLPLLPSAGTKEVCHIAQLHWILDSQFTISNRTLNGPLKLTISNTGLPLS